jgi:hypothetical protein
MHNHRLSFLQWKTPADASFEFTAICCNVELTNELLAARLVSQHRSFGMASSHDERPDVFRPGADG